MSLDGYTNNQLREELFRRLLIKPEPINNPNFDYVIQLCKDYLAYTEQPRLINKKECMVAHRQQIFEQAMYAVFGMEVLNHINTIIR